MDFNIPLTDRTGSSKNRALITTVMVDWALKSIIYPPQEKEGRRERERETEMGAEREEGS